MKIQSIVVLDENKLIFNVDEGTTAEELRHLSETATAAAPGWSILVLPGDPAIYRVAERPDLEEKAAELLGLVRDAISQRDAPEPAL